MKTPVTNQTTAEGTPGPLVITGGVTTPKGFEAAGAIAGIKKNGKPDLAIIYSKVPATCAAVFTTNIMKAAPILWNQKVLAATQVIDAIVINSGNANACTGAQGMANAEVMAVECGKALKTSAEKVLVASTGVIGVQLPIEIVIKGISETCKQIGSSAQSGLDAAIAITTTDTYEKQVCMQVEIDGKTVTIGAMAKGSGMIHPNMATMLSFVTTDVSITSELLEKALKESTLGTYNMISVDGDTSTNDMVTVMANGQAGNQLIKEKNEDFYIFSKALNAVNTEIAKLIVKDGEGATKFLEVNVSNASSIEAARTLARAVVSSSLVKAAFFGEDANWGRIICAMGYSGAGFDPAEVTISMSSAGSEVSLMLDGEPVELDESLAKKVLAEKQIVVNISLKNGKCAGTAWGCDLSYDYVKINGAYRT